MASSIPSLHWYPQTHGQFNTLLTGVSPNTCSIHSSQRYPQTHDQYPHHSDITKHMSRSIPSSQGYPQTHGQFNTLLTGVSPNTRPVQSPPHRGTPPPNTWPVQYPPHKGIPKHMASSIPSSHGYPQSHGQFNTLLTGVPPSHGLFNTLLIRVPPNTWPVQYPPHRAQTHYQYKFNILITGYLIIPFSYFTHQAQVDNAGMCTSHTIHGI